MMIELRTVHAETRETERARFALSSRRYRPHHLCAAAVAITFLATCTPSLSSAQKRLPDLAPGLSMEAVRKSWGPPTEIEERETRRVLVWNYPSGASVIFKSGVVSHWKIGKDEALRSEVVALPAEQIVLEKPQESGALEANATRDLVREIAAEVPSGGESPSSPSNEIVLGDSAPVVSSFGQQQQQQIVQPVVPQPGSPFQGVNPGAAQQGGFFMPEEEE